MYDKGIALVFVCYTIVLFSPKADGAVLCKGIDVNAVEELAMRNEKGEKFFRKNCGDEQCRAARDLACAFDAMSGRDTPNTMGRGPLAPYAYDLPGYNAMISSVGKVHPERLPLYCDLLVRIARRDDDDPMLNRKTTFDVVEMAARVTRRGNGCIEKVMKALPDTDAIRSIVADVRGECVIRKFPLCHRMIMPGPVTRMMAPKHRRD